MIRESYTLASDGAALNIGIYYIWIRRFQQNEFDVLTVRFFDPDVFPSSQVLEDNWNCEDLISKVVLIIPIHLQISKTMIYNLQHSTGKKNSLRNLTLVDSNSFQYLINES